VGKYSGHRLSIERPTSASTKIYDLATLKLDDDGLILPGASVDGDGDILVGRIMKPSERTLLFEENVKAEDVSLRCRPNERGKVDTVIVTENFENAKLVKVKIRGIRIPQIGDKFASIHGQKGTCGMIFRQEDLPYTM
jgi:DNA-directed RNA polymerase II subunit RPB2